jgi:hypothetical protein
MELNKKLQQQLKLNYKKLETFRPKRLKSDLISKNKKNLNIKLMMAKLTLLALNRSKALQTRLRWHQEHTGPTSSDKQL